MVIRGDTHLVKVYDLTPLVDVEGYDLTDAKELEEFKESVASFLDSGEAEAVDLPEDLIGVVPDSMEIEIGDEIYTFEDVEYLNTSVDELISKNFEEGDVIALLQAEGDGYFEYEEEPDVNELYIGYTACDISAPDEPIYDFFCDLLLPSMVEVDGERLEIVASNFYPRDTIVAEVYVVRSDGDVKYLEKVTDIDLLHLHWDLFEDLIKVEYED
ncbi:MAG: hypothetical protein ABGX23_06210 [Nautiliaceae bacterium]